MQEHRRCFLAAAVALASSTCRWPVLAAGVEPKVFFGADGPVQRQVFKALQARYSGLAWETDVTALAARRSGGVYVSVGPGALERALRIDLDAPLVSAFTSRETFARLLRAAPMPVRRPVTALFAEVSPAVQFRLIAAVFERRVSVGVLLGPASQDLEPLIRRSAAAVGLDVDIECVAAAGEVMRGLARLGRAHVLLALSDSTLYTEDNLRSILESTYRRGQPMFGFSPSMVAAGTLASAYAGIDDTVADLSEVVEALAQGRAVEPRYPKYWRVAVNESVARSLDVPIPAAVRAMGEFAGGRTS